MSDVIDSKSFGLRLSAINEVQKRIDYILYNIKKPLPMAALYIV